MLTDMCVFIFSSYKQALHDSMLLLFLYSSVQYAQEELQAKLYFALFNAKDPGDLELAPGELAAAQTPFAEVKPYDQYTNIEVRCSNEDMPRSGEGVYATKDIKAGTVLCYVEGHWGVPALSDIRDRGDAYFYTMGPRLVEMYLGLLSHETSISNKFNCCKVHTFYTPYSYTYYIISLRK